MSFFHRRRNIIIASIITSACIFLALFELSLSQSPSKPRWLPKEWVGAARNRSSPATHSSSLPALSGLYYNTSATFPEDANSDFMGKRPSADHIANFTRLVERCRGSYDKQETMLRVNDCLDYLATPEADYLYLPEEGRASQQDPRQAPYTNADGQENTLEKYPDHELTTKTSLGSCNGPIIPFHGYWSGPATWRVELMIKSYFHTQNLECSRFWLWVDSELNPNAAEEMKSDPAFLRLMPMVERGDIILKAWKFPERMRLYLDRNDTDRGLFFNQGDSEPLTETVVADNVIRTSRGEEWVVFGPATSSVLPTAISDAVRFVVLHQHGGVYLDMDGVLMRDLRPLLLADQAGWAERWGIHVRPGDYNTQILALKANSSLSSYLLRGGVRMGMNFHPLAIGTMVWKDNRNAHGDPPNKDGFLMLETAFFDPLWGELDGFREGPCIVPCMQGIADVFRDSFPREWESLSELTQRNQTGRLRTLDTFVRGAWSYHVHNQWKSVPEPTSWLALFCATHDRFLEGKLSNFYGEKWTGPVIKPYDRFRVHA